MIPRLAAHEWLLSANGEVRYTLNTSRSNGCFRGIMGVCYWPKAAIGFGSA